MNALGRISTVLSWALALIIGVGSALLPAGAADAPEVLKIGEDPRVEDLGSPVATMYVTAPFLFRSPRENELHLCALLNTMNRLESIKDPPTQFYDLNLATGKAALTTIIRGRSGYGRAALHSNGRLYIGTGRPSGLAEYDPATHKVRDLGSLSDNFHDEVGTVAEGNDGAIYAGMRGARAARYDPKTDKLELFGSLDAATQSCVSIGADGRYVYCGVGPRPWCLVICDRTTGDRTTHFRPDKGVKSPVGHVVRATDGSLYYVRRGAATCLLRDGKPVTLEAPPKFEKKRPGGLYTFAEAAKELGVQIDATQMFPTGWNGGEITVRWRKVGDDAWRSSTLGGAAVRDNTVAMLTALPDGRLFGRTSLYVPKMIADTRKPGTVGALTVFGPYFIFDPQSGKSTRLGRTPWRTRAMLATGDAVYIHGSWDLIVFDPTRPWTFSVHTPVSENTNPRALAIKAPSSLRGDYLVRAADGLLYIAAWRRGRTGGGQLAWFNPKTDTFGSLGSPFERHMPTDICTLNNGALVVVSTEGVDKGSRGRVFVYDTGKREVGAPHEPLPDSSTSGKLMAAGPDHIIGLVPRRHTDEEGNVSWDCVIYKLNVRAGDVLFTRTCPGKAFTGMTEFDLRPYAQRLAMGPDGCGWLFIDRTLCRIHPDNGRVEKIMECDFAGRMFFVGRDLYLYNGGRLFFGRFAGIKRIRNLFE